MMRKRGKGEEEGNHRNYDKNDYLHSEHLLSACYMPGPVLHALHASSYSSVWTSLCALQLRICVVRRSVKVAGEAIFLLQKVARHTDPKLQRSCIQAPLLLHFPVAFMVYDK